MLVCIYIYNYYRNICNRKLLTFNVSTCLKSKNVYKSINRNDRFTCFTHMCRAGFADGIQIIAVLGDIWIISYWKLIKDTWTTFWLAFFLIRNIYAYVSLCTKSSSKCFRHITCIKFYTSYRHDTDSENHTVVVSWFVFHCSVRPVFWAIHWWVYIKKKYTFWHTCIYFSILGTLVSWTRRKSLH